jgi:hypothetical protein
MAENEAPALSIEERISATLAPEEIPAQEAEPTEIVEEAAQATAEAPTEEAPVAEEASAEPVAEEDVVEVSSFNELSEYLGVPPEDLYSMTLPITVGGKRKDVTLSEWKDSIVAQEEAARIQSEAKAIREEVQAQQKAAEEEYKLQLAQGVALVQNLEQQLMNGIPSAEQMEALRTSNPAEWAAKTTEIQNARAQIDQIKTGVKSQVEQYQTQMQAEQDALLQEKINVELAALQAAWPELADESKGQAEKSGLIDFLKRRGFSEDEIANSSDHRVFLLARDAMRHESTAQASDATRKKVLKIAKRVVRPGSKQSRQEQAAESIKPLRDRLRKSGSTKDAAALISELRR